MLDLTMSEFIEHPSATPRMDPVFDVDEEVFFLGEDRILYEDKVAKVLRGKLVDANIEIECWCYVLEYSPLRFVDFGQKLPFFLYRLRC